MNNEEMWKAVEADLETVFENEITYAHELNSDAERNKEIRKLKRSHRAIIDFVANRASQIMYVLMKHSIQPEGEFVEPEQESDDDPHWSENVVKYELKKDYSETFGEGMRFEPIEEQ